MLLKRALAVSLAALALIAGQLAPAAAFAGTVGEAELRLFAGTGLAGCSGDGGPAVEAGLTRPEGLAIAADGTVYISDTAQNRVRAVSPDGTIRTVAGPGEEPSLGTATLPALDDQPGAEVYLKGPKDLAVGPDGTLYVVDELYRILALAPDGRMKTLAGTGEHGPGAEGPAEDGVPARQVKLNQVAGIAVGRDGTVYVGDREGRRLRAVSPNSAVYTFRRAQQREESTNW